MKTAKPTVAAAPPASDHDHDHGHAHGHAGASAASLEAALAMADAYCSERGEKLTPIRRKVLELLLNSGRATKAYSLLDEMRQIHPGSAPPTVYRALDFLLSAGLVHRIESINAFAVCHDLTQCQHGILVVCQQCANVTELHEPKLRQAAPEVRRLAPQDPQLYAPRRGQLDDHGRVAAQPRATHEDDQLEIPAFLRRQAN